MPFGTEFKSLGLFTDYYSITMAYGYWKEASRNDTAVPNASCELYFRQNPFRGGYAVSCGLQDAIDYLGKFSFDAVALDYLRSRRDRKGNPIYEEGFLTYLQQLKFTCDIDAIPNGTVVFANQPLIRVTGPIIQTQLIESALLNIMNFQTLMATKASRIKTACGESTLVDFGLRRAQEAGGLAASYAGYVGGTDSTSNTMAAWYYNIPETGTFAHAWVMSHDDELTSFREYAKSMPDSSVFLVDTTNSISGAKNAIIIAQELRARGSEMVGIRLDSGDLAYLSIEIRKLLDDAGFPEAKIVASNDLDEEVIESLVVQGARIDVFGVGTKLATCANQPALGGVYKLGTVQKPNGTWEWKMKLSENVEKTTCPGRRQICRVSTMVKKIPSGETQRFLADGIYDIDTHQHLSAGCEIVHPTNPNSTFTIPPGASCEYLLVPIYRSGVLEYVVPSINETKAHAKSQLAALDPRTKRLMNPHTYIAGLERGLHESRLAMIQDVAGHSCGTAMATEGDAPVKRWNTPTLANAPAFFPAAQKVSPTASSAIADAATNADDAARMKQKGCEA